MSNYFRITAYHPEQDLSIIMDSNGLFEKLWQFSADLVQKHQSPPYAILVVDGITYKAIFVQNMSSSIKP